jgi:hypothetical protein
MLLVSFPGGGHLSIEFTDDAPDSDAPRLGAWLELRAPDPRQSPPCTCAEYWHLPPVMIT